MNDFLLWAYFFEAIGALVGFYIGVKYAEERAKRKGVETR
jgi:hypothetical protein